MPIPSPRAGESQDKFIGRCMSSLSESGEFRDRKQRAAVCHGQWRKSKRKKSSETRRRT